MPEHPYLQWPVFRRSVVAAFQRSLTSRRISDLDPSHTPRRTTTHFFTCFNWVWTMGDVPRHRYGRRPDTPVVAVRLALDTDGLIYRKWGGERRAKARDWIVDNNGDIYTVDADVFARTYRPTGRGTYVKTTPVWLSRRATLGASRRRKERRNTGRVITSSQTMLTARTHTQSKRTNSSHCISRTDKNV